MLIYKDSYLNNRTYSAMSDKVIFTIKDRHRYLYSFKSIFRWLCRPIECQICFSAIIIFPKRS